MQVKALLAKYHDLEVEANAQASKDSAAPDSRRRQQQSLNSQLKAELANLLTPSEAELYELWTSTAAASARAALSGMNSPTEADFQTIYGVRKETDARLDALANESNSPLPDEKRSEILAQGEAQIRQLLGEERFQQYQRAQDPSYQQLLELSQQYGLSDETASRIYGLKQNLETTAQRLSSSSANEPDRLAVLGPMRRGANQSVRDLLGETAYQYYRRNGNAEWLQSN